MNLPYETEDEQLYLLAGKILIYFAESESVCTSHLFSMKKVASEVTTLSHSFESLRLNASKNTFSVNRLVGK